MMKLTIFAALIAVASAASCTFPDNTATQLYFKDCSAAGSQLKTIDAQAFKTGTSSNEYPIDVKGMVDVVTQVTNSGGDIPQFYEDATISLYKNSLFDSTCKWHNVPTLGLTNNLDGCKIEACPIKGGGVVNKSRRTFDFSKFGAITNLLPTSYAAQIKLETKATKDGSVIGCVLIEARISKS